MVLDWRGFTGQFEARDPLAVWWMSEVDMFNLVTATQAPEGLRDSWLLDGYDGARGALAASPATSR